MFGINRRVVGIIFGILALAFIAGSVLLFTPQGQQQVRGKTEITVNGRAITEQDVARAQQSDQILSTNPQGLVGNLAKVNFGQRLVVTNAFLENASRIRISSGDLKKELDTIKQRLGVKTDAEYQKILQQYGYTDSQLRDELRDQLRIQKRLDEIQNKAEPSDAEMALYFDLNKDNYKNEERVQARQIVVDDKATADKLYKALQGGADFADTAKKNSKLNADQGGAMGEVKDNTPGPVAKVVFPNAVAEAVFKLKDGGLTSPIEAGGRFYIVKVEKYLSGGDTKLEEVKDRVKTDAKKIKGQGAVEAFVQDLTNKANVKFADNATFKFDNPVVAKVGDSEIKLAEVAQAVFSNQQVPQLLQQGMGDLAVQFFMPQTLEQLVSREVVVQAAKGLGQPFFGSKTDIYSQAQQWKTKDLSVSDAEVKQFYTKNQTTFTVPAQAKVQTVAFKKEDKAKADTFRAAALKGGKLEDLAKANAGTVQDNGMVNPNTLPPVANKLVFLTKGSFPTGPLGEISDVVKLDDGSFQVLIVNDRKAEVLKSFDEVKDQARIQALAQKRSTEAQKWVAEVRKQAKVENTLDKVIKSLTPAPAKTDTKPATGSGTATTPSTTPSTTQPAKKP